MQLRHGTSLFGTPLSFWTCIITSGIVKMTTKNIVCFLK
jgi:hypothetical protein